MSRRDTIIIAVLLNAGLLIVLFATSLKSDSSAPETSGIAATPEVQKIEEVIQPLAIAPSPQTTPMGDEVDQMVKQYTPPTLADGKPNFAADLNAIGGQSQAGQEAASLAPTASFPTPEPMTNSVASSERSFKEVKVKKGDVLERIARNNHVSVDELMKANNLSSTRLKIGQVLKVPGSKATAKAGSFATGKPADEASSKFYTVKVGDNPWTIAVKNHMKVEELLKLNNLNEEKARRLKPGDKIRIK